MRNPSLRAGEEPAAHPLPPLGEGFVKTGALSRLQQMEQSLADPSTPGKRGSGCGGDSAQRSKQLSWSWNPAEPGAVSLWLLQDLFHDVKTQPKNCFGQCLLQVTPALSPISLALLAPLFTPALLSTAVISSPRYSLGSCHGSVILKFYRNLGFSSMMRFCARTGRKPVREVLCPSCWGNTGCLRVHKPKAAAVQGEAREMAQGGWG